MSGLDSLMAALIDRADTVAELVDTAEDERRRAELGLLLARHVRALTSTIRERAGA